MSEELHDTHQWGERDVDGQAIPCCLVCRVDGYENEPDAFAECPGEPPPPEPKKGAQCGVTMESLEEPGHLHVCGAAHATGDHHCRVDFCQRWFWTS